MAARAQRRRATLRLRADRPHLLIESFWNPNRAIRGESGSLAGWFSSVEAPEKWKRFIQVTLSVLFSGELERVAIGAGKE